MNAEELTKIITSIQSVVNTEGINVTPDALLTNAINFYMFQESEKNKDKRTTEINKSKEDSNKITAKQITMLKNLEYQGEIDILTKKEASVLISEGLAKRGKDDQSYY